MIKGTFRATRRCAVLAAAALMLAPLGGAKAAWPEKPIKIVLPFGAGGVADVTARIMRVACLKYQKWRSRSRRPDCRPGGPR